MKQEVINKLTSSKNERIAFGVIWDRTAELGKKSRLILNDEFYAYGISTRKALNLAVNRLQDKGLIFKLREIIHNHPHDAYRYAPHYQGVVNFLNGEKT
jgi:hypothetical protein